MLTAAILAGGASSRIGANNALLSFRGQPMISAVADVARPVVSDVVVVADYGTPYRALGLKTVADLHMGRGPLGGLHAALTASGTNETLLRACDIPLVSTSLLQYIAAHPNPATLRSEDTVR